VEYHVADSMRPSEEFETIEAGTHLCLLYDSVAEQKAVALPFLRGGWLQGERCFCVVGHESEDTWSVALQAYGIDVDFARTTRSLVLGRYPDRPGPGQFNSVSMARTVWAFVQDSLISFSGVRFAVDMASSLARELPADQLCHWEATFDLLHGSEAPIRTVCMYDRRRLPAAQIDAALRTHAYVLVEGRLCLNSFYEASEIIEHEPHLNASSADVETVERMIATLLGGS